STSEKISTSLICTVIFFDKEILVVSACLIATLLAYREAVSRAWIINLSHKPTEFDKGAPWLIVLPALFWLSNSLFNSFMMKTFYVDVFLSLPFITWAGIMLHALKENNDFDVSKRHSTGVYVGKSVVEGKTYPKPLIIPMHVRRTHSIVFGTTGATKTMAVARPLIEHDLLNDDNFQVIIDFKADSNFRDLVFTRTQEAGKTFRFFDISNPDISDEWNPLAMGGVVAKRDKVMSFTKWSNEHYEKVVSLFVLKRAIEFGKDFNFGNLRDSIDPYDKNLSGIHADIETLMNMPFAEKLVNAKRSI
ncbi:MAG: hypothetical protein JKY09_01930, partial [Crocinitomicaceae bacterium]|nr:hypothetical protein [Crocinitomicaceae bacterium]